jgi:hypothetical protein
MATTRRKYRAHATAHQPKYGFRYRENRNAQSTASPAVIAA